MSEPKFTKGEWKTYGIDQTSISTYDESLDACIFTADCRVSRLITTQEMAANACLISAAPDLYNALVAVRAAFHDLEDFEDKDGQSLAPLAKQIDEALNKATGNQS